LAESPRSLAERLAEFYSRLAAQPVPQSGDEAFQQICDTLEAVEDEWSGVPKKTPPPPPNTPDGRMYPPLADFVSQNADGSISAMTRGHIITIGADGAVEIRNKKSGSVEFARGGRTS